jgi:Kelch motif protein
MTLNLTVVRRDAAFQSSDFRLTRSGVLVSDSAPKRVQFAGRSWTAQIAYTGMAEFNGVRLSNWLADLGAAGTREDNDIVSIVDNVRVGATREFRDRRLSERHTFIGVVIWASGTEVFMISNFEGIQGPFDSRRDEFQVTSVRPRTVWAKATGRPSAVTSADLKYLKRLAARTDPKDVLNGLADVNRRAAARTGAGNSISEGCLASYLLADGSGVEVRYGDVGDESFIPPIVLHGVDFASVVEKRLKSGGIVKTAPQSSVVAFDGHAWQALAPMLTARQAHSATVLSDGRVLVVGGHDGRAALRSAEIYSPTDDEWREYGPLLEPRRGHVATRLDDGRVIVVGGTSAMCELFDPVTGMWSHGPVLLIPRSNHTVTASSGGRILVAGGSGEGPLRACEIVDPREARGRQTAPMRQARYQHAAVGLGDGRIMISGGNKGSNPNPVLRSVEIYDPQTERWEESGELDVPRHLHTMLNLPDGSVVAIGGDPIPSLLAPDTNRWVTVPAMPTPRGTFFTATCLDDHRVLVCGGQISGTGWSSDAAETLDVSVGEWVANELMPTRKMQHATVALPDGRILAIGGATELSMPYDDTFARGRPIQVVQSAYARSDPAQARPLRRRPARRARRR